MVVATFNASSTWVGKTITYEDEQFVCQDFGVITAQDVLECDREALIEWAEEGLREWTQALAQVEAEDTEEAATLPKSDGTARRLGNAGLFVLLTVIINFVSTPVEDLYGLHTIGGAWASREVRSVNSLLFWVLSVGGAWLVYRFGVARPRQRTGEPSGWRALRYIGIFVGFYLLFFFLQNSWGVSIYYIKPIIRYLFLSQSALARPVFTAWLLSPAIGAWLIVWLGFARRDQRRFARQRGRCDLGLNR